MAKPTKDNIQKTAPQPQTKQTTEVNPFKRKVKKPWPLKGKLVFWPLSVLTAFLLVALYTYGLMLILYDTIGSGSYLLKPLQIIGASAGFFVILFLLEWVIRRNDRHLTLLEYGIPVYVVPPIVYGILLPILYSNITEELRQNMDRFVEDAAFWYFSFLLFFYYALFALAFRGFAVFLSAMREYQKIKHYKSKKTGK